MQTSEFMAAFSFAFMKAVTAMIVLPVYTYFRNYKIIMWKFCSFILSWVENKKVADRLLNIWSNIKIYKYWKGLRKSAQPSCKSFQTVLESLEDTLTSAKSGFFGFVATHIEPFLVKYQTDQPMVPFLYDDLTSICRKLLELIVKPSLITDARTSSDLMQIDLSDSKNLLKVCDVRILCIKRSATPQKVCWNHSSFC